MKLHVLSAVCSISLSLSACAQNTPQITPPDYATSPLDLSTPQSTAYSMMIAMYRGDTNMIDQIFTPDARLRRLSANGDIEADGLKRWRDWVGTLEIGQAHEELFNIEIETFNTLATVWAPFTIQFNGEIVGCGVNQFTMANQDGDWRIVSGIDVQAPKDSCAAFKQTYKAAL